MQEADFGVLHYASRKKVVWEEDTLQFLDGEDVAKPDGPQVLAAAQAWVEGEDGPSQEEYLSAVEGAPALTRPQELPAGMDVVLTQLSSLAEAVSALQSNVKVLQGDRQPAPTAAEAHTAPSAVQLEDPMRQLARLAGPPPRTRATAAASSKDLIDLEGEELTEEELASLAEEGAQAMSTDQMLRLALVKALGKGSKPRKKVGLALGNSSDEEEEDPLRRLSGARGTLLQEKLRQGMDSSPMAYVNSIESMAASCLGQAQPTQDTMEVRPRGVADWLQPRPGLHDMGHRQSLEPRAKQEPR